MEGKLTYNEKLNRFEPITKLCSYCKRKDSTSMQKNFFLPLYNVSDRTNLLVYKSVKFKSIIIGVPRCDKCYEIHEKAKKKAVIFTLICIFLAIVLCGFFSPVLIILVIIFAAIFFKVLEHAIRGVFVENKYIKTEEEGAEFDKVIWEFKKAGWRMDKPTAKYG